MAFKPIFPQLLTRFSTLPLSNVLENVSKHFLSLSVIRQKYESQNGCNKKAKRAKFFEKQIFLTLPSSPKMLENLACFVFLLPPF